MLINNYRKIIKFLVFISGLSDTRIKNLAELTLNNAQQDLLKELLEEDD